VAELVVITTDGRVLLNSSAPMEYLSTSCGRAVPLMPVVFAAIEGATPPSSRTPVDFIFR